jgi:RimJ/RimL family protein N-acetyltransferase
MPRDRSAGDRPRGPLLPPLSTARLDLRAFVPADLDDVVRLDGDAHVMRYIADGRALAREAVEGYFTRVLRYPSLNAMLGAWRASRRDTGEFIGWFSLKYAGTATDIEIGYRLRPEAWGRGYATEGATAMRDHGFGPVGLRRIIGVTHPGNVASQRVLRKIGMRDEGWGRYYDRDLRLFAIEAGARG